MTLRATKAEIEAWEQRAAAEGRPVSAWGRDTLNEEVKMRRLHDAILAGQRVEIGRSAAASVSGTAAVAAKNARPSLRVARIMNDRGERVESTTITDAQARELLASGAVAAR